MITDKINNNLDALFNPENDDIYKSLICNKDNYPDPKISLRDKTIMYNSFDDALDIGYDDSDHQVNGAETDVTGVGGIAVFNGSTSEIDYGISPIAKTPFSFSCRFYIDPTTGGLDILMNIGINNISDIAIIVYASRLTLFNSDIGLVDIFLDMPNIENDTWYFLYIQIDGVNIIANLDGTIYDGILPSYTKIQEDSKLYIGRALNLYSLNGALNEVYLFNDILNENEIDYISDNLGTTIHYDKVIPTDFQIGAIASQIEYLRKLSIDLMKQIFINTSELEFLKYQLENFFNSLRLSGETNKAWVSRTIATVLQQKVSRASIIYVLRPYSSQEPEISFVELFNAYADFCYADIYNSYLDDFVLPAIAEDYDSDVFTIKITLYDTALSDIATVYDILSIMIAAGISYILEIIYT